MTLLEEYIRDSYLLISRPFTILIDEQDSFSVETTDVRGQPLIMGANRCTYDFWRNVHPDEALENLDQLELCKEFNKHLKKDDK